jgi:hypothetical protein
MKRFANVPKILNNGSVELHPKVTSIDDDNQVMIPEKFTTVRN